MLRDKPILNFNRRLSGRVLLGIQRHLPIAPLLVVGLFRHEFLFVGDNLQDSWRQFDTFSTFGQLNEWTVNNYKSTRTVLVFMGQSLVGLFGTLSGLVVFGLTNLILLYAASRFFLKSFGPTVDPISLVTIVYFTGFHGPGGWTYGVSLTLPIAIVVAGILARYASIPPNKIDQGVCRAPLVLVGLLISMSIYVHPIGAPPMMFGTLLVMTLTYPKAISVRRMFRETQSLVLGAIAGIGIGEMLGVIVGRSGLVIRAIWEDSIALSSPEQVSKFQVDFSDWFPGSSTTATIGLLASVLIHVVCSANRNRRRDQTRLRATAIYCIGAISLIVLYEWKQRVFMAYDYYAQVLLLYVFCLFSAYRQSQFTSRNEENPHPDLIVGRPLIAGFLIIMGWQVGSELNLISLDGGSGIVFAALVGFGLIQGSARNKLTLAILAACLFLFGLVGASEVYALTACKFRSISTRSVISIMDYGRDIAHDHPNRPIFVVATSAETSEKDLCKPTPRAVVSSIAEQVWPLSEGGDLIQNIRSHPFGLSILVGANESSTRSVLTEAELKNQAIESVPGSEKTIGGLFVLSVQHISNENRRFLEAASILRPGLEDAELISLAKRIFTSETYLTAIESTVSREETRVLIIAVTDSDLFGEALRTSLGYSKEQSYVVSIPSSLSSSSICKLILDNRPNVILASPGIDFVQSGREPLQVSKTVVKSCLVRNGLGHNELASNSESPGVFLISDES